MVKQAKAKQERVIETVRHGFEGDKAVEFIRESGFAINGAAIARHLRAMGGRQKIAEYIGRGLSNLDILAECFPGEDFSGLSVEPPSQGELFVHEDPGIPSSISAGLTSPFETTKLTLKLPTDLYEAIRLAAKAEGTNRNLLIVDILTNALSQMPKPTKGD